jgi:hypothetical protein
MNPSITVKCTTCGKKEVATQRQLDEAKAIGCVFSSCCSAVAVVDSAKADLRPKARP